jgi:putative toxin-antitoxin system antitoxin component (TIGR02293 family)
MAKQTGNQMNSAKPAQKDHALRFVYTSRGQSMGLKAGSTRDLHESVSIGLPFRSILTLGESSHLLIEEISSVAGIPSRTLSRRKAEGRFRPEESDRLLRVSTVFERAVGLFDGDRPAATQWLRTPQPALGGQPPLEFARTEVGAGEVLDLIGRLEHGVFT